MTETEARADLAARAAKAGAQVALESFRGDLTVETKSGKTDLVTQTDRAAQQHVVEIIREEFPNDSIVGEERVERSSTECASGARRDREGATRDASRPSGSRREAPTTPRKADGERSDPQAEDALKRVPEDGPAWIIDPIDGTSNFVRGLRIWGTSVAVVENGEPIAAATVLPALADTYLVGPAGVTLNGDPVGVSDREDPETFAAVPILLEYDETADYAATVGALVERFGDVRRFGSSQATLAAVAGGSLEAAIANVEMSPWDTVGGAYMIRESGGTVTDLAGEPWRHDSDGIVASNGVAHEAVLAAIQRASKK